MEEEKPKRGSELSRAVSRCWLSIKQTGRKILESHDYDMTMEQLMALFILDEKDGQTLRALAEQADRERTTMTRMVDGLERRKLVVRVADQSDRRNKLVYLTPQGRQVIAKLEVLARAEFESVAFKNLTEEEVNQATEVLYKIISNLNS